MISITTEGIADVVIDNSQYILRYPCADNDCYPYRVDFQKGRYLIECWGASGSLPVSEFVRGAYSSGILEVQNPITLYAYLGNVGTLNGIATFNGGGRGSVQGNSGGGATDFRLVNGSFSSLEGLISRVIVAGGGAGLNQYSDYTPYYENTYEYGNGGSQEGGSGYLIRNSDVPHITIASGGSQKEGGLSGYCTSHCEGNYPINMNYRGKLGIGADAQNSKYTTGGGGGYFGGGAGGVTDYVVGSGVGGSSYVSGHPKCSSIVPNHSSDIGYDVDESSSIHHSGIEFYMPTMISGNENMVEPNGAISIGHSGPGYAKITILPKNYCQTYKKCYTLTSLICLIFVLIITK